MKYCDLFLKKIEIRKIYLVKFKEDSSIKPKIYIEDCVVRHVNWWPIIFIIYNKNTFNANDS